MSSAPTFGAPGGHIFDVRRSRVIGDYRGYRRLIAYYAVFDREGVARHW